jgi:D-aminopeptidase
MHGPGTRRVSIPPPVIGSLPAGAGNAITDVDGVTVGHATLAQGPAQTGVTVVLPHAGDLYRDRVPAAAVVINGFGKSIGLLQVEELGVLETPITLTNTFSVAAMATAQIRQCLRANPEVGRSQATVNPLVFECNDGFLNAIQNMALTEQHYLQALGAAGRHVAEGSVGAGRGMSCFGAKGGIGTASRRAGRFTLGALVLANFGRPSQLLWGGHALGPLLAQRLAAAGTPQRMPATEPPEPEKGSIIMLLATDAPLDARQLRRLALRAGAGLARSGSVFGHGSGDIAVAFSTAYTVPQDPQRPMPRPALMHDALMDGLFQAAADSTEQAIVHALWHAETVTGRDGQTRHALAELIPELLGTADLPGAQNAGP